MPIGSSCNKDLLDLDVYIERKGHLDRDYGFILGLFDLKSGSGLDLNIDLDLESLGPVLDHDFEFRSGEKCKEKILKKKKKGQKTIKGVHMSNGHFHKHALLDLIAIRIYWTLMFV